MLGNPIWVLEDVYLKLESTYLTHISGVLPGLNGTRERALQQVQSRGKQTRRLNPMN